DAEPGRLTFVTRMGAGKIGETLPKLLDGIGDRLPHVTWVCDPMHGNTITSNTGYKTRRFEDVMAEVEGFFNAHRDAGTIPGGLHIELTGDDVTEIMGGATEIDDEGLRRRYETLVDPRLNHDQSLEMAFQVAEYLTRRKRRRRIEWFDIGKGRIARTHQEAGATGVECGGPGLLIRDGQSDSSRPQAARGAFDHCAVSPSCPCRCPSCHRRTCRPSSCPSCRPWSLPSSPRPWTRGR